MTKKTINVGSIANPTGDSLKNAFVKVNDNFTELYNALGLDADTLNIGAFEFAGSTISTTDSTAIVIDQAATITSNLSVGGDILPSVANGGDLGSSTLPWRSLYVSNNTIYIGGTAVGLDANGNLTVNGGQVNTPSSTLVNGANTVSLGSDGVLTLPGGRTRIGASLDSDAIIANEDEAFGVLAQGTNGAVQIVWIEDLENAYTSNLAAVYVNSGGPGSVRIATGANGGPGPNYWEFKNSGALTFPQGTTIGTADGGEFLINGAVDKDVYIYTYSGETARGWTFGTDGSLQIPGDIKSNGNINIDINLSDSTLRRWQFGEDGALTFPDGTSQTTAGGGGGSTLVNGAYSVVVESTGAFKVNAQAIVSENQLAIEGNGAVQLQSANGSYITVWNQGNTKEINLVLVDNPEDPSHTWTFNTDRTLILPDDSRIKSATNIDITIDTPDSSTFNWRFGADGTLTLPLGGVIAEGGGISGAIKLTPAGGANANQALLIYPTGTAEGDHIHLTAGGGSTELYLGNDTHYVKLVDGGNVEVRASTANLSAQAAWTFETDGELDTIQPLGIKVPNGVPTNVTLINSTTGSWEMNPRSNLATTGGSGTGLTVNVTEEGGYASTIEIATAGTGYNNGDLITVTSGSSNATFTIVIGGRNTWQFDISGRLILPYNAVLKSTAGNAIAFGNGAGQNSQGGEAVAIGTNAGYDSQGADAVAIGTSAGETDQGEKAVAIGDSAGYINQGDYAVAIGHGAGNGTQGSYAVAIGMSAGETTQAANSIVINATGATLNQTTANTFTVKPVRQGETADAMYYNSSTGEITYADVFSFNVAADDSTQRAISNNELIKFIGAGGITTASDAEGNITITGSGGGSSIPTVVTTGAVGVDGAAHCKVQFTVTSATTVTAVGVTAIGVSDPSKGTVTLSGSPATGSFDLVVVTNTTPSDTYILIPFATNASGTGYGAPGLGAGTNPCLVRGTMITMADMSRVAVENITYNDDILVWDFDLGEFASAKPIWIKKTQTAVVSCLLTFSDHSELQIVGESPKAHRIFNKEAGKFTYGSMPETPIGTTTFNDQGEEITLVSKEWIVGEVEFYNVMTDYHMNLFANSILTSMRYNNVYPITDMKFVKDSRTLRTADDYPNVEERLYKGFRLAEQTQSVEEIETHIQWLLTLEVERETECV